MSPKITCPECGFVHECGEEDPGEEEEEQSKEKGKDKGKGYNLYWVPCHCGCGCGHECDLLYGPYGKAHNQKGRDALDGELGKQLKAMRAANAKIRKGHLTSIHNDSGKN